MAKASYPTYIGWYQPHSRAGDWDGMVADPKTGELVKEPSMTKQSFADECDINNILRQYRKTGVVSHIRRNAESGAYTDLPDTIDFQDSINTVARATEAFSTLPSRIRRRFDNNPAEFLQFITDPANQAEAVELGLASAPKPAPSGGAGGGSPASAGGAGGEPPAGAPKAP